MERKKLLSLLLSAALAVSSLPISVAASSGMDAITLSSDTSLENAVWTDENGDGISIVNEKDNEFGITKYIHVETGGIVYDGETTGGDGFYYTDSAKALTAGTYRVSFYVRSQDVKNETRNAALRLAICGSGKSTNGYDQYGWKEISSGYPDSYTFTRVNGNSTTRAAEITEEWTFKSYDITLDAADKLYFRLWTFWDAEDAVSYDIAKLSFINLATGEELIGNGTLSKQDGNQLSVPAWQNAISYYKTGNTASVSSDISLDAGNYTVTGCFRLSEIDMSTETHSADVTLSVLSDNEAVASATMTLTNEWQRLSINLAFNSDIDEIRLALPASVDFHDLEFAAIDWTPPLSIPAETNANDLLGNGHFDGTGATWLVNGQYMEQVFDENGGYLKMQDITTAYAGFDYYPSSTISEGTYKFTGYFRTANFGQISLLQLLFYYEDGTFMNGNPRIYATNEWIKAEFYITLTKPLDFIRARGGPYDECIQEYCVDQWTLEAIEPSEIPAGYTNVVGDSMGLTYAEYAKASFQTMPEAKAVKEYDPELEAQYEVEGIIINHDCTNFLSQVGSKGWTPQDIIDYALQFEGTHVTDYMINVSSLGMTVYPSDELDDYVDKYHATEENGQAVDFKDLTYINAAHMLHDVYGTDYVGLWCETFPTIGINPWLSFRMNDVHYLTESLTTGKPHSIISQFYFDNPELRRITHHPKVAYMDYSLDYQYRETRDFILRHINDALNRYDPYGIELDFQRELRLFGIGAEYRGLDILNGFMREVDDLIAVYEEKYGHEIKTCVRVGSTIETNYDFGLDVITWAAEGVIDLVIPTGRYESSDFDTPIAVWSSLMKPHGVEVAPCIEQNIRTYASGAEHSTRRFTLSTGFAANAFSQGADKIALYNYFLGSTDLGTEKATANSDLYPVSSGKGAWNLLTTIGSYEKLMTRDRRCIMGYNDTTQIWYSSFSQLPLKVNKGTVAYIRVPVGDVPDEAVLTFKISTNVAALIDDPPTVYVNSEPCTFVGTERCKDGFTTDKLLCYKIPAAAHDGGYMSAEIISDDYAFTAAYVEVYVDIAD